MSILLGPLLYAVVDELKDEFARIEDSTTIHVRVSRPDDDQGEAVSNTTVESSLSDQDDARPSFGFGPAGDC